MITRTEVQAAADQVASDAWANRETPGELERADEVRRLAALQIADDTFSTAGGGRDRIGDSRTGWVMHHGMAGNTEEIGFGTPLWSQRSHEQLQLEAGLRPILDSTLTWDERDLIRYHYAGGLTQREIAERKGTSQKTIDRRLRAIRGLLRETLTKMAEAAA